MIVALTITLAPVLSIQLRRHWSKGFCWYITRTAESRGQKKTVAVADEQTKFKTTCDKIKSRRILHQTCSQYIPLPKSDLQQITRSQEHRTRTRSRH